MRYEIHYARGIGEFAHNYYCSPLLYQALLSRARRGKKNSGCPWSDNLHVILARFNFTKVFRSGKGGKIVPLASACACGGAVHAAALYYK